MTRIHMRATAAALLLLLLGAHAVAAARSLSADDDVQPAAEGHPPMWAKGQVRSSWQMLFSLAQGSARQH